MDRSGPLDGAAVSSSHKLRARRLLQQHAFPDQTPAVSDDTYYRSRPTLGLPGHKILKLNSYVGLNGKLTGLKALFDQGHLSVVQGVGYPNPNRSHVRSTEIWQTASDADRNVSEGWLGRYFDNCCAGADPTVGVAIGEEMPQAFAAKAPIGITFSQPEQFRWRPSEKAEGRMSAEEFFFGS